MGGGGSKEEAEEIRKPLNEIKNNNPYPRNIELFTDHNNIGLQIYIILIIIFILIFLLIMSSVT